MSKFIGVNIVAEAQTCYSWEKPPKILIKRFILTLFRIGLSEMPTDGEAKKPPP